MSGQNISEILFEKFCANAKIQCLPVPRERNRKTPDYDLAFGALKVVAEVKEIERNEEEKESDRLLELRGYGNAKGGVPGQRVRQKIQSCLPQIKARAQGLHPGMLVLYDQHLGSANIDPYHIRVAMYGLENFVLAVPENDLPYVVDKRFGTKRKMTPDANTSISAIAALRRLHTGEVRLYVYHNKYAAIPLFPAVLASYPVPQYRLADATPGTFSQWDAIT
jgi:hypothetical protein